MTFQKTKNLPGADSYSVVLVDSQTQTTDSKIAACRDVFSLYYKQLAEHFIRSLAVEAGSYLSKKGGVKQGSYLKFLQRIEGEKDTIFQKYICGVMNSFDHFWSRTVVQPFKSDMDDIAYDGVSLIEEEVLEEEYALSAVIRSGEQIFFSELQVINRQFSKLAGRKGVTVADNPVGPAQLSRVLADVLNSIGLELWFKLPVYRVFERLVLNELGVVYRALIALLDAQEDRLEKQDGNAGQNLRTKTVTMGCGRGDSTSVARDRKVSDWDAFRSLQSALVAWRQAQGIPTEEGGDGYEYYEILSALTSIQKTYVRPMPDDSKVFHRSWLKEALLEELTASETGESPRKLSFVEETAVDLVSMIFGNILQGGILPKDIAAFLAILQVPVAKVAILDKSLFLKAEHPVRRFVDELVLAASDVRLEGGDSNVVEKIKQTITELMEGFDLYIGTFTELHTEFSSFMGKHRRRKRLAEGRTVQLVQSREKLAMAKEKTAREISRRLEGERLPEFLGAFLNDVWKDRLILAYLREDKEPGGWNEALSVMDKLLETVVPPSSPEEKKKILAMLPDVISGVRTGSKLISYDRHLRSRFFKDLAVCHVVILNSDVLLEGGQKNFCPSKRESDVGVGQKSCVCVAPEVAQTSKNGAEASECSDDIEGWKEGQWIEFKENQSQSVRGKLAWVSPETGIGVFVDPQGAKLTEKTRTDFQAALRSGQAVLVEPADVPVMEVALAEVMRALNVAPDEGVPALT